MTRQRMYLDINVVDAARERIRHVYDTFDEVWLQFSGGKDSAAALYLMKELHEERGLGPVNVIFRDEEMLPPSVIDYVTWVKDLPWVNMEWYCLPYGSEIWTLGRREYIMFWSPLREKEGRLLREIPPWAIRAEDFGLDPALPLPESIDYYTMQGKTGRIAFVTGVRANESMVRYRSCVQKLHENYIVTPFRMKKSIPLKFAKVIYDWTTDDVFKYIHDSGGKYCEYYDWATISGSNTRIGIPLHAVAVRRIKDVVETEPEFYDRLWECFPEIDAQRRYWPDFDIEALIMRYAESEWAGVSQCIEDNMKTPGIKNRARAFSAEFRKKHLKDPYSYPVFWLIKNLMMNEFHTASPTPIGPGTRAHAIRVAQANAELNDLDMIDDAPGIYEE